MDDETNIFFKKAMDDAFGKIVKQLFTLRSIVYWQSKLTQLKK